MAGIMLYSIWMDFAKEMALGEKARKRFFFEKKNQKTFIIKELWRSVRTPYRKSFCVFFQKEALSFC
jgi:hypothetical protein